MDTSVKGLIAESKRRVGNIHPEVMKRMELIIERCKARNVDVIFTQGLRTMVEQATLYGQGRSTYWYNGKNYGNVSKPVVTNAVPGTSIHNYGLALDFALIKNGTQIIWDTNVDMDKDGKRDWLEVVEEAKKLGFDWGGDWTSFKDYPHIEWTGNLSYAQIFAGKKPTFPSLTTQVSKPVEPTKSKAESVKTESLVDYLTSKKIDSSFANREKLAKQYGIKNYKGTADQNVELLALIKKDVDKPKVEVKPATKTKNEFYNGDYDRLITLTEIGLYTDIDLKKQVKRIKKDTKIDIQTVVFTKSGISRFHVKDSDGKYYYCSSNKAYVKAYTVGKTETYTVKKGDSLSKIASANKTSVDALVKLNKLKDKDSLQIGQVLKIK